MRKPKQRNRNRQKGSWDERIKSLQVGDEIGATRVVWKTHYLDKERERVYLFIGINKKGKFKVHRADSSVILQAYSGKMSTLKEAILACFDLMKKEVKLKHKAFRYE